MGLNDAVGVAKYFAQVEGKPHDRKQYRNYGGH